jgi:hypothetical protein
VKFLPQRVKPVATRTEKMATQPATGEALTYAAVVKAHPPQQPNTTISKSDAGPPSNNTEMNINQQLQLILAKLYKEKAHTTLVSRLERLQKCTPLK